MNTLHMCRGCFIQYGDKRPKWIVETVETTVYRKKVKWHYCKQHSSKSVEVADEQFTSTVITEAKRIRIEEVRSRLMSACDELDKLGTPYTQGLVFKQMPISAYCFSRYAALDVSLKEMLLDRIELSQKNQSEERLIEIVKNAIAHLESELPRFRYSEVVRVVRLQSGVYLNDIKGETGERIKAIVAQASNDSYARFYISLLDRLIDEGFEPKSMWEVRQTLAKWLRVVNIDAIDFPAFYEYAQQRISEFSQDIAA